MANRVTANKEVDMEMYIEKMNMTNMGGLHNTFSMQVPKLFDLVTVFRSLDAADPRDKLYAFRGLVIDQDSLPLLDYSKPIENVYCDFTSIFSNNQSRV